MGTKNMEQVGVTPDIQMEELTLCDVWVLLWRKKLLIVFLAVLGTLAALPHCFLSLPLYSGSIVITPASIATMGGVVREINEHSTRQSNNVFDQASELSESVMGILKRNLMSQSERQQLQPVQAIEDQSINLSVIEDRQRCAKVSQSFAHSGCNSIVVTATGPSPGSLKARLDSFVQLSADQSAQEANQFLESLGITTRFTIANIYRVESPATVSETPFSPNKPRALVIGATLGAMLGVFVVIGLGYRAKRKAIVDLERDA